MKKRCFIFLVTCLLLVSNVAAAIGGNGMVIHKDEDGHTSATYRYVNEDLVFDPQLQNRSNSLVNSVVVAMVCYNAYEEPIYPDDDESGYIRYFVKEKGYAGGRIAPYGDCTMKGCKDAAYIGVAIIGYQYREGPKIDLMDPKADDIFEQYDWHYWAFE